MDYYLQVGQHAHGHGQRNHYFESKSPQFFKIILHETIQSRKLRIPKKFAEKYCISDFSETQKQMVSLKLPSGDVWNVEMKKCDTNQLWLHGGWPEFVDFYGIKHGHVLVFKYKRRGIFHVHIFDTSTIEIKYPLKLSNGNKDQDNNIDLEEDQCHRYIRPQLPNKSPNPQPPAIDEVISTSSTEKTIEIDDIYAVVSERKMKPQKSNRRQLSVKSRACGSGGGLGGSKRPQKLIQCSDFHNHLYDGVHMIMPPGQAEKDDGSALHRSSSFDPTKPSFSIVMQPSYVHKCMLNVPRSIFLGQLGLKSNKMVKLCTSDGRSWTAKFYFSVHYNQPSCKLGYGWRDFVKDNNLVEGDVCVFKLIDPSPVVFHVTICKDAALQNNMQGKRRRADQIICSQSKKKFGPGSGAAINSASKHISFQIVMTQRYLCTAVTIPGGAAMRMFMLSKETVTNMKLKVGDRTWRVKAFYYPKYRFGKISAGWTKFVKENSLKVGEICSFELVDSKKLVMRVSIQPAIANIIRS